MHLFVTRPTAYVSWQRPWPWARTWPAAGKRRAMMARNIQPIGEKPAALNQRMFSEQLTQPSALERLDPSKMEVLGFAEVEARTVPPTRNAAHVYKIAQKSHHSNRPQTQVCRQDAPCPPPNPFPRPLPHTHLNHFLQNYRKSWNSSRMFSQRSYPWDYHPVDPQITAPIWSLAANLQHIAFIE